MHGRLFLFKVCSVVSFFSSVAYCWRLCAGWTLRSACICKWRSKKIQPFESSRSVLKTSDLFSQAFPFVFFLLFFASSLPFFVALKIVVFSFSFFFDFEPFFFVFPETTWSGKHCTQRDCRIPGTQARDTTTPDRILGCEIRTGK